ncbi:MAG: MotA/TolQ/ExbB proton channel family protein [Akkermansiaceae bacterium]|jgi:biopolymer transport protein ExbB|nr:MotA/TolQ/ExbB proton channel family protein [Akkermansiaceae bacterium]MDP4647382.1 MotA/TolQ/ExbB proton channel family protein [Akkermansiaceae bacterium]MDP4721604.1 MotA/TolQ/ExbB proton channel family protein [Akkermansiaceae bacterium]MDP4779534.1 MotA/TolQ/ExbB proton channel family protein [Akkermansiaceae bacterium]MDP4847352.1 MotA/TolQ/ExbB proton channel family protein [Akkermansiaceae bacterium]
MSRIIRNTLFLGLLSSVLCHAQSPIESAKADLDQAVKELGATKGEYSDLRRALYRDINRLDDEALKLGKELRDLQREEERRQATNKTLEREVEGRKTDFNYSSGILAQYSKALASRLHPAENQIYLEKLNTLDQKAASAVDDPKLELAERIKALDLGIDRIGEVAGGHRFDGKALRNGSESVEGKVLVVGPSVFFAQKNGDFEGVATYAETGTMMPTVVAIKGSDDEISKVVMEGKGELPFDGTMGKAIEVEAAKEGLWETAEKGGYVGHAILGLGLISFIIAGFKVWEVSKFKVPSRRELNQILDDLLSGNKESAMRKAAAIPGEAGEMVQIGVKNFHEKRRVLEESLFEKMVTIKPHLERFLPFLALTAAAGPLMGLLGTVLGIIKTFQAMALYGSGNTKNFTTGISEALITTAEGLIVAIPVLVVHGLLKSMCKAKFGEIEGAAIALVNGTTERGKGKPQPEDDGPEEPDDDIDLVPTSA